MACAMEKNVTSQTVVSRSGGKDSALALWYARQKYEVAALVSNLVENRITMHGVII